MKVFNQFSWSFSIILAIFTVGVPSFDAYSAPRAASLPQEKAKKPKSTKVTYGHFDRLQYSRSQSRKSDQNQFGLGIATSSSGVVNLSASPSMWLQFTKRHALQLLAGLETTSPGLSFGFGGLYRYTLNGTAYTGLHTGGGFGLGTTLGSFYFNASALLGVHFIIPSLDHILFNFDAGATLAVSDGSVSLRIGGYSPFLGASIHYLF